MVVTFWSDPDVKRALTLEQKAFFAYLFSNEHSHPCGVYRLPPVYVLDELGVDADRMKELIQGPLAPFATYDWRTEEIFVHNMGKHQFDRGLRGKDNRIQWVVNHLETIHSESLLEAFRERYGEEWNLPWQELFGAPAPPTSRNLLGGGTERGASKGPSEGLPQAPPEKVRRESVRSGISESNRKPQPKPRSKGIREGLGKPDPDPDPDPPPDPAPGPVVGIQPPAESSGDALKTRRDESAEAGRREVGSTSEVHPATHTLWTDDVRQAIINVWYRGSQSVVIHGNVRHLGAEFHAASDVLKATDGDVELVRWLILAAPRVMGWDDEPRSLRWLAHGPNLEQAIAAYHQHQEAATIDVRIARPPERRSAGDRQVELRDQLHQLRAAQTEP